MRSLLALIVLLGLCLGPAALTHAEDAAPAGDAPAAPAQDAPKGPELASEAALTKAMEQWDVDTKEARRLKDDDRVMQYDLAMERLTRIQHPKVVEELVSLTRHSSEYVRLLAVMYLGTQTLMPSLVGEPVAAFMRRHKRDDVALMTGLETIGLVKYLGASSQIQECLEHREFVVKKYAMECVGQLRDMRLIEEMLKQVGVDAKASLDSGSDKGESGGKETEGEAVSWEGVDVTYDTGTAGDGDQKMAEKIGKEKLAKNQAEAQAKAGAADGGGRGAGGGGSGTAPRGGTARSQEELIPPILRALKRLTGEEFGGPRDIKKYLQAHRDEVLEKQKYLDTLEKQQDAEKKHFK